MECISSSPFPAPSTNCVDCQHTNKRRSQKGRALTVVGNMLPRPLLSFSMYPLGASEPCCGGACVCNALAEPCTSGERTACAMHWPSHAALHAQGSSIADQVLVYGAEVGKGHGPPHGSSLPAPSPLLSSARCHLNLTHGRRPTLSEKLSAAITFTTRAFCWRRRGAAAWEARFWACVGRGCRHSKLGSGAYQVDTPLLDEHFIEFQYQTNAASECGSLAPLRAREGSAPAHPHSCPA